MSSVQRKVVIVTSLGKKYAGSIDIPSATFRTSDLLNSAHIYWKDPNMKCYDDAVLLYNVRLLIDNKTAYKRFETIQVKLPEIVYFYDDTEQVGDETEKKRANGLKKKVDEKSQTINIITTQVAKSFYDITGVYFGLFKKKSQGCVYPTDTGLYH